LFIDNIIFPVRRHRIHKRQVNVIRRAQLYSIENPAPVGRLGLGLRWVGQKCGLVPVVNESWSQKTRVPGLPGGGNRVILWTILDLLYWLVTDRRTDKQMAPWLYHTYI